MHLTRHYTKGPLAGNLARHARREIVCVHCARSLGMQLNAAQPTTKEAGHMCAEKLLSRQPASPPPYN